MSNPPVTVTSYQNDARPGHPPRVKITAVINEARQRGGLDISYAVAVELHRLLGPLLRQISEEFALRGIRNIHPDLAR